MPGSIVITMMEMVKGLQKVQREDALKKLLTALKGTEIFAFEREAAKIAGRIFGDLERNGQPIGRRIYSGGWVAKLSLR